MLNLTHYLDGVRRQLREDAAYRQCFETYLDGARNTTDADATRVIARFLQEETVQASMPGQLHGEYDRAFRELSHLTMRLALLAQLDEERRTERSNMAARLLMTICRARDWVTQGKNENRFRADLWTGTLCGDVPVLYALLKDALTSDERAEIVRAVIEKGIRPVDEEWLDPMKHWHALDTMGHNWHLVIVCGAGVAALTFRDEAPEECQPVLDRVFDVVPRWFRYPGNAMQYKKANFGPDGDYIEYLGYMIYGFSTYFLLEFFYRDQTGLDTFFEDEFFRPQPQMLLDFCRETAEGPRMANFGDASALWSKHQHVYYCMAIRLRCGELMSQQRRMTAGPNCWEDFLFYPLAAKVENARGIAPARMAVYPHVGVAVVRTGAGADERFFAMKAGESWNHNHLDAGTFILTDKGWNIAVDSGTCDYGNPEYRGYYTASRAHNTLLLDGRGQDPDMFLSGSHQDGRFTSWLNAESAGLQYLQADCTGPYAGVFTRFFRHAVLLKGWTILLDDVQAFHPGELTWQMHFDGEAVLTDDHAVLHSGEQTACVYPLFPKQRMDCEQALATADRLSLYGPRHSLKMAGLPKGQCLTFRSAMQERRAKVITAISRAEKDTAYEPECRIFEGGEELILRSKEGAERLIVNHRADGSVMHANAWLRYNDIYTDAFLVYLREDANGRLTTAAMVNGSRLAVDGGFSCGTLVKADACFDLERRRIVSQCVMDTPLTLRISEETLTLNLPCGYGESAWATMEAVNEA